jgi:hypothetical protein
MLKTSELPADLLENVFQCLTEFAVLPYFVENVPPEHFQVWCIRNFYTGERSCPVLHQAYLHFPTAFQQLN